MKTTTALTFVMGLLITGGIASPQVPGAASQLGSDNKKSVQKVYDGTWWLKKDTGERYAFMDGLRDCLRWVALVRTPYGTGYQFEGKITQYYVGHPEHRTVPVLEIWRKVEGESARTEPIPGGEVWSNPHWYLNGLYWRQLNYESTQQSFLDGYLWCMRTCVSKPTETYSRPVAYYVHEISSYIATHPKTADDEAIANILSRFRDNPKEGQGSK